MSRIFHDKILSEWQKTLMRLYQRPTMQRIHAGSINKSHYMSILFETYHNAGINPQQQAFATMFFAGRPRDLVKKFYQHAISEIAHDLLALNDLKVLGVEEQRVVNSKPLPQTAAFTAFPVFQTMVNGPLGYLGYLYHLERLPTGEGGKYMDSLKSMGVPVEAMTFIEEHSTVDVAHNKMMDFYIEKLVQNDADCRDLIYYVKSAAYLHSLMLEGAIERVDADPDWLAKPADHI